MSAPELTIQDQHQDRKDAPILLTPCDSPNEEAQIVEEFLWEEFRVTRNLVVIDYIQR